MWTKYGESVGPKRGPLFADAALGVRRWLGLSPSIKADPWNRRQEDEAIPRLELPSLNQRFVLRSPIPGDP